MISCEFYGEGIVEKNVGRFEVGYSFGVYFSKVFDVVVEIIVL